MVSTGRSLMPEGLEKQIGKPEMADLLAFLVREQATTPPALDVGTEPAQLVEPGR